MMVLALSLPGMAQAHFIRIETESVIALERDEPSVGELQGRKYDTISQRVTFFFLVEASR
jgi:hypothetical protein